VIRNLKIFAKFFLTKQGLEVKAALHKKCLVLSAPKCENKQRNNYIACMLCMILVLYYCLWPELQVRYGHAWRESERDGVREKSWTSI
jgi:hypothetical protein